MWKAVGQHVLWGTAENWKEPVPSCSGVPVSFVLLAGPSLDSYYNEIGDLTSGLRSDSTPERTALSSWDLVAEGCGKALAPGCRWKLGFFSFDFSGVNTCGLLQENYNTEAISGYIIRQCVHKEKQNKRMNMSFHSNDTSS